MAASTIQDQEGNQVEVTSRKVECWEDAPDAKCLVSYCTPDTREIVLVALRSGETFAYEEWNGGGVVEKRYRCVRGLKGEL